MRSLEFNVWKDIKDYEDMCQVSMDGKIRRIKASKGATIRELSPYARKGYLAVRLFFKGKGRMFYVHRLVAQTFIPNPYDKLQVNHKDGDKYNNRSNNLEWATCKENVQHAKNILGVSFKRNGESNGQAKLTEIDVIQIKRSNLKQRELAIIYKVARSTISMIKAGYNWRSVT